MAFFCVRICLIFDSKYRKTVLRGENMLFIMNKGLVFTRPFL